MSQMPFGPKKPPLQHPNCSRERKATQEDPVLGDSEPDEQAPKPSLTGMSPDANSGIARQMWALAQPGWEMTAAAKAGRHSQTDWIHDAMAEAPSKISKRKGP